MSGKITITFAASALNDLREMQAWYAEQLVPEIGTRFIEEIIVKVEALQTHPDMGRIVPEFGVGTLRELIHPPFRIVYRYDAKRIRIVRIWRSERLLKLP
ncbi:MAG: type II toxin-antitoxin system RelE/ParE family toxin [Desulfuromonadales bacterium]